MITLETARTLEPGTYLQFNTSHIYEVVRVEPVIVNNREDVMLVLRRDDGHETFAGRHDLDVAELRGKRTGPAEPPAEDKPAEPELFIPATLDDSEPVDDSPVDPPMDYPDEPSAEASVDAPAEPGVTVKAKRTRK